MEEFVKKRLIAKKKKELIKFGISFGFGMLILFIVSYLKKFHISIQITSLILCCFHIISVIIYYKLVIPTHFIISNFGKFLSYILTAVFLGSFYDLIFTPYSFFLRLSGKDHIKNELLIN